MLQDNTKNNMWKEILYVGAGSFVGGALRYVVSLILKYDGGFPWATFVVNLLGCLLIGVLWGLFCRVPNVSQNLVLFLSVGLCGGFTTFSTFSKESVMLMQSGNWLMLALYILGSILLGVGLVAAGYFLTK
jgi:CrcB protein